MGSFGVYMADAMVSSGHLPLMMLMLFLAFLAEGLVASLDGHLIFVCCCRTDTLRA